MDGEITVQDVYDSMISQKKEVLHLLVGLSLKTFRGSPSLDLYPEMAWVYQGFNEMEKAITGYLIAEVRKERMRGR